MIEIKMYEEKYIKNFTELIDKCFWIKNNDIFWLIKWKFFHNIYNKNNKIVCAYHENNIIWQYSNISLSFSKNKYIFEWYLCQDMCVSPNYRGKWLISKMSSFLYNSIKEETFSIWFSNEKWIIVDKNSKWYWYNIIDNISKIFIPIIKNNNNFFDFEIISNFDEIKNINFNEFKIFDNLLKIYKSNNYIKWRYFEKPNGNYKFYIIKNEWKIIWYCVFRFNHKICTIFDFNIIDNKDNKKFIYTIKKIAYNNKIYIISFQILYNNFWKNLLKWFFHIKTKSKIYFTIKNHNNFDKIELLDKENWSILTWDIL
jgi:hypothetical protein